MIVDMNAWTGHWMTLPLQGGVVEVRNSLKRVGVDRILISPLDAVWCHNPHLCNGGVYDAARQFGDLDPVPVLDPTIPTWLSELHRAVDAPQAGWVKLLPNYHSYRLEEVEEFLSTISAAGLGVIVQVRMEDPRRQHPLAQVPDASVGEIAQSAARHPGLKIVIGGAPWPALVDVREALMKLPNLYADISQVDGLDRLKNFVRQGLGAKLLFGSHTPLFVPLAGLARLVDLDQASAKAILSSNAISILDKS